MFDSLVARVRQLVNFLRYFPLTAPAVAAIDTIVRVLKGNLRALLAEPWVVGTAIFDSVNIAGGDHLGFWGHVGLYALAACRWFTSPIHEQPA